jgi:hypothetical protein
VRERENIETFQKPPIITKEEGAFLEVSSSFRVGRSRTRCFFLPFLLLLSRKILYWFPIFKEEQQHGVFSYCWCSLRNELVEFLLKRNCIVFEK